MAGSSQPDGGIISGINVTPLVDIMLVLLVIFIVTAKIIVAPAVPLDLPKASSSQEVQLILSVTIPESGPMFVNAQPVADDATLAALAKAGLAKDSEIRVVINADGAVPHRKVIHTLDVLKSAGVVKVAFGALPEETP